MDFDFISKSYFYNPTYLEPITDIKNLEPLYDPTLLPQLHSSELFKSSSPELSQEPSPELFKSSSSEISQLSSSELSRLSSSELSRSSSELPPSSSSELSPSSLKLEESTSSEKSIISGHSQTETSPNNTIGIQDQLLSDNIIEPMNNGSDDNNMVPTSAQKWWASIVIGFIFGIISSPGAYYISSMITTSLGGIELTNGRGPNIVGLLIHTIIFILIVRIILW